MIRSIVWFIGLSFYAVLTPFYLEAQPTQHSVFTDILPQISTPLYVQPYGLSDHLIDRIDVLQTTGGPLHLHTAIRPYYHRTFNRALHTSVQSETDQFNLALLWANFMYASVSNKPIFKYFYRDSQYLFHYKDEDAQLAINPVFHFEAGRENNISQFNYVNTRGAEVRGHIGQKIAFYSRFTENQALFPTYVMIDRTGNQGILRGESRTKVYRTNGLDLLSARGYVSADVLPQVNVQLGHDRNFIGNGFRSLLLSDQHEDYFFLKINTRFGPFHYQNLFAELIDSNNDFVRDNDLRKKYMTAHFLSVDINKNLNLGIFESVVRGSADSMPIDFQLSYLNPLIFYRAVEYGLGSSDNVTLGLNVKYNFLQHFSLYGQFVLDDWQFFEVLNGTGWWANRYGGQLGLKYYDMAGISNLDGQVEWNAVRPFTYSHNNLGNNYTHYAQPLAHPLGANFSEWIVRFRYQPVKRLMLDGLLLMANQGVSTSADNQGENIFITNVDRATDFNHKLGQGTRNKIRFYRLSAAYMVRPNVELETYLLHRTQSLDNLEQRTNYIGFSLRVNFEGRRFYF